MEGILVGVDESPHAQAALRWPVDHALHTDQRVTAVMAWAYIDQHHLEPNAPFDPRYSSTMAAKVLDDLDVRAVGSEAAVERRAVCDLPAAARLTASADASMLVVGARGMGGFRGLLLDSVSRQVLHRATCPVAVIRDDATRIGGPVVVLDRRTHRRAPLPNPAAGQPSVAATGRRAAREQCRPARVRR